MPSVSASLTMRRVSLRRVLAAAAGVVAVATFGAVMGPAPASAVHGPLATVPAAEGERAAQAVPRAVAGTLRLVDGCVLLARDDGGPALVVWPAERTRWHPRQGWITVERPGGAVAILAPGDRVSVLGTASRDGAEGRAGEDWADDVAWTSAPADVCVEERPLWVADVVSL